VKHLYSYKYRLYPTLDQKVLLSKHFGCCRYVYNHFLAQRIEEYEDNQRSLKRSDNEKELPILKRDMSWLKEVGSQSLQYSVECLQIAYDNFFHRLKERKKGKQVRPGFPVFKKCHDRQSFRVKQGIKIKNNLLVIPKFLEGIPMVIHRELDGNIEFATISKTKSGNYHVSITVTMDIQSLPTTSKIIGIDLNVKDVVTCNGTKFTNPRPEHQHKSRLRLLSKQVSRCEKGSKGRQKARRKLAKFKQYCHDVREDFLHKLSSKLINENQVICVEDLCVESMLAKVNPEERKEARWKERKRHRDIQDCGFYSLVQKLTYKALWYGRQLVKVSRWFPSSQLCNHCGWRYYEIKPHEREWVCMNCWEINDRDTNAARNILDEGRRIITIGTMGIADCPGVRPTNIVGN
jgi:putative transposase